MSFGKGATFVAEGVVFFDDSAVFERGVTFVNIGVGDGTAFTEGATFIDGDALTLATEGAVLVCIETV